MKMDHIEITPSTKVGDLLDFYPELEETLISIAPPFKKLKNQFLRKSVAKVATIKHIASVGNIPLNELIRKLRLALGQPETDEYYEEESYFQDKPEWFSHGKIVVFLDEATIEDKTKITLASILSEAKDIKQGEIVELKTTFLPAPGIDKMRSRGYSVWAVKGEGDQINTYFMKNQ